MYRNQEHVSAGMSFAVVLVLVSAIALEKGMVANKMVSHFVVHASITGGMHLYRTEIAVH